MPQKKSKQIEKIDKKYLWHPFTQMKDWEKEDNIIIEKGKGSYLWDINGKKYLDGVSSLWVTVHGHQKKEIDKAINDQLKKVAHSTLLGLSNVPAAQLAEKLVKITPKGLDKVFYSDSGSEAVEIALKIAFQYWQQSKDARCKEQSRQFHTPCVSQKTKFITLENAYHGDTIGSVSVGGINLFHKIYKPLLFDAFKAPSPFNKALRHKGIKALSALENIMKKHHKEIAAMIVEPLVQAAAGMLVMPKGYLKAVRMLCTKYDILMICDEVATGFGRTGKMFACEHENISPDIITIAKGISGGYLPIAATLTTKKIYDAFLADYKDQKTFFHGHTYTGNPLAAAAAIANIDIFKKENTLKKLQPKIKYLQKRLKEFYILKHVGDIRQCGMMIGIELIKDKKNKKPYAIEDRIGIKVIMEARKNGLILRPLGNVIVLMPPLSISMNELRILLDKTYNAVKKITKS